MHLREKKHRELHVSTLLHAKALHKVPYNLAWKDYNTENGLVEEKENVASWSIGSFSRGLSRCELRYPMHLNLSSHHLPRQFQYTPHHSL